MRTCEQILSFFCCCRAPVAPLRAHRKGCKCKKSQCSKNYCECYQAGLPCIATCRCDDCGNEHGTKPAPKKRARPSAISESQARVTRAQQEEEPSKWPEYRAEAKPLKYEIESDINLETMELSSKIMHQKRLLAQLQILEKIQYERQQKRPHLPESHLSAQPTNLAPFTNPVDLLRIDTSSSPAWDFDPHLLSPPDWLSRAQS